MSDSSSEPSPDQDFTKATVEAVDRGWQWTRKRVWFAARLLHVLGPEWLAPRGLLSLGIDASSVGAAVVLTVVLFAMVNRQFCNWADEAYHAYCAPPLVMAASGSNLADSLVKAGWADESQRIWLNSHLRTLSQSTPLHELIETLCDTGNPETNTLLAESLRQMATGDRHGVVLVRVRGTTGAQMLDELEYINHGAWLKTLTGADKAESTEAEKIDQQRKRAVLTRMFDETLVSTQRPLRWLHRVNGWMQWLTVALACLILCVVVRRFLLFVKLRRRWLGSTVPTTSSQPDSSSADWELWDIADRVQAMHRAGTPRVECIRDLNDELTRLGTGIEEGVYSTLGFMVGMLPSLGFIGTVIGMGAALLQADGLFGSADRQLAITVMTRELGFAFDTTLVALVAGLVVGMPMAALRVHEREFFQACGRRIAKSLGT